jgi:hypothetical protein
MKRIGLPIIILALLGAFLFWWFSPVQMLKRRTQNLLETLTMESGTGAATRQMGVYSLNALLAEEVELESGSIAEANGTFERSEMESFYSWLSQQAKQTRFDLINFETVEIDDDTAEVSFALEALVELPSYRPADGKYDVDFRWRREDDGWRLTSAKWTERK